MIYLVITDLEKKLGIEILSNLTQLIVNRKNRKTKIKTQATSL